jgi:hypothetical protein
MSKVQKREGYREKFKSKVQKREGDREKVRVQGTEEGGRQGEVQVQGTEEGGRQGEVQVQGTQEEGSQGKGPCPRYRGRELSPRSPKGREKAKAQCLSKGEKGRGSSLR